MQLALLLTLSLLPGPSGPVPGPGPGPATAPPPSPRPPGEAPGAAQEVALPGGATGIGFDDLGFAPALHAVVVPGGRTGAVFLADPATRTLRRLDVRAATARWAGGHGQGITSADAGPGVLFAADRDARRLVALGPEGPGTVRASASLGGGPDYVRWVETTSEVWVTEPREHRIEVLRWSASPPRLEAVAAIDVADGPESLVVDAPRGVAYANTWHDETVVLDVRARAVRSRWKNGCVGARGLALDPAEGRVFVGCEEGAAVALDGLHGGRITGRVATGAGVDIVAYAPARRRLYVPGADAARLDALTVGADGTLAPAWQAATAPEAHCAVADDAGHVWVCAPRSGRLLVFTDPPDRRP